MPENFCSSELCCKQDRATESPLIGTGNFGSTPSRFCFESYAFGSFDLTVASPCCFSGLVYAVFGDHEGDGARNVQFSRISKLIHQRQSDDDRRGRRHTKSSEGLHRLSRGKLRWELMKWYDISAISHSRLFVSYGRGCYSTAKLRG